MSRITVPILETPELGYPACCQGATGARVRERGRESPA